MVIARSGRGPLHGRYAFAPGVKGGCHRPSTVPVQVERPRLRHVRVAEADAEACKVSVRCLLFFVERRRSDPQALRLPLAYGAAAHFGEVAGGFFVADDRFPIALPKSVLSLPVRSPYLQ